MATDETDPRTTVARPDRPRSGLNFFVAKTLEDVIEGWGVVYQAYHKAGLIDANPFELHTSREAVMPGTAVIAGCLGPLAVSTISAYVDGPGGLPLDSVYPEELAELRKTGRRFAEVGLFADRRDHLNRSAEGLFELMRFGFWHAVNQGCDDIVIGVHPDHVPFYRRFFRFEQLSDVRSYPTVKNNPVSLLRLDVERKMKLTPLPKGLAYFNEYALGPEVFEGRFSFKESVVATSMISRFLAYKSTPAKAA